MLGSWAIMGSKAASSQHFHTWSLLSHFSLSPLIPADTVGDLGFAQELGNYGEYSGAPNTSETYAYAKTVLECATSNPDGRGKALLVGGGIANFTGVWWCRVCALKVSGFGFKRWEGFGSQVGGGFGQGGVGGWLCGRCWLWAALQTSQVRTWSSGLGHVVVQWWGCVALHRYVRVARSCIVVECRCQHVSACGCVHSCVWGGRVLGPKSLGGTWSGACCVMYRWRVRAFCPRPCPPLLLPVDVAATFKGIIQAIRETAPAIKAANMRLFIRRGGPNYQQVRCGALSLPPSK